jgi:serine protease Do
MLSVFVLSACESAAVNEIYNKSYIVSDINIEDFENLVVAAIEKAEGAVIGVTNYQKESSVFGNKETPIGSGSGVVYSCSATLKDGSVIDDCSETIDRNDVLIYNYFAITNRHVIENKTGNVDKNNTVLRVLIGEDDMAKADIIEYDDKVDLAVIKFSHYVYINPVKFADSNQLKRGQFAIAIGSPSGHDYYGSATFGIVSFPKRYMSDDTDGDGVSDWDAEYIQHDVAINPGNSGGALINIKGELIGINTLKLVSSDIDNMGFAIPSNVVKGIVEVLETGKKPKRNTLGIKVTPIKTLIDPSSGLDPNEYNIPEGLKQGLYVVEVSSGFPAYNKLKVDDIIIKVGEVTIKNTQDFRAEINKYLGGDTVKITVIRNNKEVYENIFFNE